MITGVIQSPHPIVSAARFRRPNTLESTIFPTSVALQGNRTSQTPNCSLASSVLLPKIGFDPLTHGPFIQHKRHMRYSQSWLLATAKPDLFNQGCIRWLRFATQQCTLYR